MTDDDRLPDWDQADRLQRARRTANLTRAEMAAHLGCSERTIRNYESGATRPNRATLMAWANLTDVPLWWLVDAPESAVTRRYRPELVAA